MNHQRVHHLKLMLQEDPTDVFCRYALALEYATEQESVNDALILLEQLKADSSDYLPLYYQLANLYKSIGRLVEAHSLAVEGIKLAELQKDNHTKAELEFLLDDL